MFTFYPPVKVFKPNKLSFDSLHQSQYVCWNSHVTLNIITQPAILQELSVLQALASVQIVAAMFQFFLCQLLLNNTGLEVHQQQI